MAHKSLQINHQPQQGIVIITASLALLSFGAAFLHPFAKESSYATDSDVSVSYSGEDWVISAPTSTAADAGGLDFDIEGNPNGVNMAKKDTVTAGTTNVPNYQIYVSVDTEGGKIPNTSNSDYSIAATSGTVTDATDSSKLSGADTLSNNSWGYALASFNSSINYNDLVSSPSSESWSSSKWSKLPYIASTSKDDEDAVESTAAKIYDSATSSGGSVDVYYAVNANNDLASGEYQTTVTYTLIGEMPTPAVEYMQDFTTAKCKAISSTWSSTADDIELVDKRDNSTYIVRKLADGNCWMAQNLRLTADTLSANNHSTELKASDNDTDLASGSYTMPSNASWQNTNKYAEGAADASLLPVGSKTGAKATGDVAYARGAYYSWATAVANPDQNIGTSSVQTNSICPKNWDLPTYSGNLSFQTLYTSYSSNNTNFDNALHYYTSNDTRYAGIWYSDSSQYVGDAGSGSYWWSSTSHSSDARYAWDLDEYSGSNVRPQDNSIRYRGYSVRCVLAGS